MALAVAIISGLGAAAAQAPAAERLLGRVVGRDGRPVGGAMVQARSWPLPERPDLGVPHLATATTAANGQFALTVHGGRGYSLHASWRTPAGARATVWCDEAMPGPPIELQEGPPPPCRTVVVRGGEGFGGRGPLQLELVVGRRHPWLVPLPLGGGRVAVVPDDLPAGPAWLSVRTATGYLVRSQPFGGADAEGQQVVVVADARRVDLAVRSDQGQPVPDAAVYLPHDFGSHGPAARRSVPPDLLGRTGAAGELTVWLPADHPVEGPAQPRVSLWVAAPGHQAHVVDVVGAGQRGPQRVTVRLRAGRGVRGRWLGHDGQAAPAGLQLLFETAAQTDSVHPGGGVVPLPPMPLPVAADGAFRGDGIHGLSGGWLFAVAATPLALGGGAGVGASPSVFPVAWVPPAGGEGDLDLGDLRLAGLAQATAAVVTHDGVPVPAARLRVVDAADTMRPIELVADRAGRGRLVLPEGTFRVGAFVPGGGVAVAVVRVPEDLPRTGGIELRLSAPRWVRGRVEGPWDAGLRVAIAGGSALPREIADLVHAAAAPVPVADDGSFAMVVPFGGARWGLRAVVGQGGDSRPGPVVEVEVGDADEGSVELVRPPK